MLSCAKCYFFHQINNYNVFFYYIPVRSANDVSWKYTHSVLCNFCAVSMHAHRLLQAALL